MAGLFSKQAAVYAAARPTYPKELFAKLAALTPHHRLAWDVGTRQWPGRHRRRVALRQRGGHGRVRGAAASRRAHPKVRYLHTPDATPREEDLVAALGGKGGVDYITVAEAAHWFDLPAFYGGGPAG